MCQPTHILRVGGREGGRDGGRKRERVGETERDEMKEGGRVKQIVSLIV